MLVLFCLQVVQSNNNESNWKKMKKKLFFILDKQKICKLARYIIDKIHKELKFNIDHHIKTNKNHNIFKFNNV
jgi:hypothetical protein